MTQACIYALTDPDTGEVRYIGKASYPEDRLTTHCTPISSPKTKRDFWINSLLASGKKPKMIILDKDAYRSEHGPHAEKWWIKHYVSMGANLTNTLSTGSRSYLLISNEIKSRLEDFARSEFAATGEIQSASDIAEKLLREALDAMLPELAKEVINAD